MATPEIEKWAFNMHGHAKKGLEMTTYLFN
jgi:hypothetical protein